MDQVVLEIIQLFTNLGTYLLYYLTNIFTNFKYSQILINGTYLFVNLLYDKQILMRLLLK